MKIIDIFRTWLGIRKPRQLLPPGKKPVVGSNVVREQARIHLKYPISNEQWARFSQLGWRVVDMRTTRRQYRKVDDSAVRALVNTPNLTEFDKVHHVIVSGIEREIQIEEQRKKRKRRRKSRATPPTAN